MQTQVAVGFTVRSPEGPTPASSARAVPGGEEGSVSHLKETPMVKQGVIILPLVLEILSLEDAEQGLTQVPLGRSQIPDAAI